MKKFTQRYASALTRMLLMIVLLATGSSRVWSDTFTIDFYDSSKLSSTSGTGLTNNNYSSFVSVASGLTATNVVTNVSVTGTVQYGKNGGLTFGTSTAAAASSHKVTFSIGSDYKVTKCTVYAAAYETGRVLLNNNAAGSGSLAAKGTAIDDITTPYVWDNLSNLTSLVFTKDNGSGGNQKRITIYRIVCEYSSSTSSTTKLSQPQGLSSSNITTNGATLTWDNVENASSYTLKIGDTEITNATSPYSATNLSPSTQYNWTVKAIGDGTNYSSSDYATEASFTTEGDIRTLIDIEVTGTPAEFWKGDTFNHDGMTVTATWDDESETDVTAEATFSTPDLTTVGQKTVTVTYKGETDTYNIDVKTIANTQATAYTITEAIAKYNAGKDLTSEVYVKGTVSAITIAWSDQYNNITYAISEDGTTVGTQFQLYRCITNGCSVGDDVVAYGTLGIHSGACQLEAGNSIVASTKAATLSIEGIVVAKGETITPVINTNISGEYAIEYTSSDENVVIAADDELATGDQTGTATITATIVADGYKTATTTFTVTVTSNATLSSIAVSGDLTKSTYTVGDDFDFSGLTATGTMSDGTKANLTNTVTWSIEPATLAATTTQVTVKATLGEISGTKNYDITVNKKTASISINNMTLSKTDANVAIVATTTPEDAELTYSIVSGAEYVSLSDGKVSAVAPGEAAIKAEYAGNDEYATAETTFTVTVENYSVATKGSFTAGDNSGSHNFPSNTDISFEAFKGGSATAPAINSGCLRLYQGGGYVTITGIKGVKIQSVTLTTGSTYTSTTVGYCVDNNNAPTTGQTVAKSSEYTISNLNNQSVSIYCLGTDKDTRLDIASLSVKYVKEEVSLSSIALSGTYKTAFIKNEAFVHDGAVVTATFSDSDKQEVTSSAVFSEPDMTTTGEKTVTVSYTHEGVTKNTTYTITVDEEVVTKIALSGVYAKVFKTSDTFSHEGVVVTATYNSGRSAQVEDAEFSTPDLATTGTKTVTVTYAEKSAIYTIKVIPASAIFFESFDTNEGTGGNDGKWSGSIASNSMSSDNSGWTFNSENGAKECAKFGTSSAAGSAKTPVITLTGAAKITFKAAAWNGSTEKTTLTISATSGTLSETSVTMAKGAWTEYTIYITDVEASTRITFAASQASNNRFFLDEVLVEAIEGFKLSVSSAGYATLCLPNKVTIPAGVTVYTCTYNNEKGNVTLTQLSDDIIPANTGVIVQGDEGIYTFEATNGTPATVAQNDLIGVTERTLLSNTQNGEAGQCFIFANGSKGIGFYIWNGEADDYIGANKAFMWIKGYEPTKKNSFISLWGDDETSISSVTGRTDEGAIYNLAGQKLSKIQRGINIVNGKKIMMK